MSTSTSLTERVRAARERRGFTEDQLRYDPLLRSMIEHVARSEERAATEDELAAAFAEVGAQHGRAASGLPAPPRRRLIVWREDAGDSLRRAWTIADAHPVSPSGRTVPHLSSPFVLTAPRWRW